MNTKHLRKTWISGTGLAAVLLVSGLSTAEARALADDPNPRAGQAQATQADPARTGRSTADRDRGAGEVINDAWITTKINSKLATDGDVSVFDISVETRNNVVHLSGDVESQAQIDQAVALARDTEGVARVDASGLNVNPDARRTARSRADADRSASYRGDARSGRQPETATTGTATPRTDHATAHTDHDRTAGTRTADRDRTAEKRTADRDRGAGEVINDAWITTKINSKLATDGDVSVFDISVETRNNVVHLSGDVESQAQIDQAVALARDTEGVTRVDASGLNVNPDARRAERSRTADAGRSGSGRADARTGDAARTTAGRPGTATTGTAATQADRDRTAGRTTDRDRRGAGEAINDAWITTKVNSKLAMDGDVSVFDISVETRDNVVHLEGEVENRMQRDTAIRLARETEGVRNVQADALRVVAGDHERRAAQQGR